MHKKLLITTILLAFLISITTLCFANDENMQNPVQNIVGGAENMAENAAKDVGNAAKDVGNAVKDAGESAGNMAENVANETKNIVSNPVNAITDADNTASHSLSNNTSNGYNVTRTSTEGANTLMGMNATMWTWLIIGLAAIGIIALVWYYSMQFTNSNNRRD